VTTRLRSLPPRRLLAVAASVFLFGGIAQAADQQAVAPAAAPQFKNPYVAPPPVICKLGAFSCPPRPVSFELCRPNAMMSFYDPTLPQDTTGRDTALANTSSIDVDSSNMSVYHLKGSVHLTRWDQMLNADTVDYNSDSTEYDARGNVKYQEAGTLIQADHMYGTQTPNHGNADNVEYQMLQSHGNGTARHAEMIDPQHSHYSMASYSTCDLGKHVWEFRGKSIVINKDTGVGVARSATIRYKNVPFLWLPYFTFPVDDRRKSGFLFPTFGNNSNSGFYLSAPYYFNLAPNYDATVAPTYYSKRGFALNSEFRYLTPNNHGTVNLDYMPDDKIQGGSRYLYKIEDASNLGNGYIFQTSINRASDNQYFRDFSNDLYTTSIGILTSNAYIYKGGNWWSASFGADAYQNVDAYLPDSVVPYKRWPRATLNLDVPINRWLEFGMTNEAVAFRKDDLTTQQVEGNRVDLYPYLKADFQGASWFVRPKFGYRYTGYQLLDNYAYQQNENIFNTRTPSRIVPITSLDTGLIFDRDTNLFGTQYTQTLEPRVYYLYVPYRNQGNLPLFDTNTMSFDYWQLFTENRFSGADRQMDANNVTAAITTRLLDDYGVERFSASVGQIRYLSDQKVQAAYNVNGIPQIAPTDYTGSDYVAQATVQLDDQWRASSSYQWNPEFRRGDLGTFAIQRRLGIDGVLNFSYRYRRQNPTDNFAYIEQFDSSVVYPISDRWRLLGRWVWSRKDERTLEAMAGVEYDSCCVAVRLIGRHYVSNFDDTTTSSGALAANSENAVMFEVEFKGLGASNPQTEEYLRRGILGYQ
jgi:LPS-assembly protein